MTIVLSPEQRETLNFLWNIYCMDSYDLAGTPFGGITKIKPGKDLIALGFAAQNPEHETYIYITQAGANFLGFQTSVIKTPFDAPDELTAARGEIARLTAENTALKEALSVADTGWSECISIVENLVKEEGNIVPQWVTSKDPWTTAQEFKRRKDDIRALYRGE